jgi:hypothetical protein
MTIALASAMPSMGQAPAPEPWQLQGSLGATLSKATNSELFLPPSPQNSSGYSTVAGDLSLLMAGYLKDPKLLPFTIDFSGEHGSNAVALGSFRDNVYDTGVDASFLPDRPFPLHFFYRKSQYGADGTSFGENSDTSSLGFEWALRVHRLPHLDIRYLKQDNEVRLITSLTNSNYRLNNLNIDASDKWKGWAWNADFTDFKSNNSAVEALVLTSPYQEDLKVQSLLVGRTFWDNKARLNFMDRLQWQQDQLTGQPSGKFTDAFATAELQINHTPKLSSNYSYTFTRISTSGETPFFQTAATGSSVSLIQPLSINSDTFGGGVAYQAFPSLSFFEQLQDYRVTATQVVPEAETSEADSYTGAQFAKLWRGFDVGAGYTAQFQLMGTTLDHHPTTFSNNFEGRVAWGDPRRVRLVASGVDSKYNLVIQLGAYTTNQELRMQAETTRLLGWHLRGAVERVHLEYLSVSGDVKTDATNFTGQIEHRRVALSLGHETSSGAGALFPGIVATEQEISVPLPLSELVATPLLNRVSRVDTAALILHLRRQLDVLADFMSEKDVLTLSRARFLTAEVSGRYRLGKIGIQVGFGSYRISNVVSPAESGTLFNRYFFRVTRDFRLLGR